MIGPRSPLLVPYVQYDRSNYRLGATMGVKSVETLGSKIRFSSVLDIFFSLPPETMLIFSNYWMRLSRIWRILQIKEGVIHRGRRPRWITLSEICRILHILRKPNSIIALLFIQNIYSFLRSFAISLFVFLLTKDFVPRLFRSTVQ